MPFRERQFVGRRRCSKRLRMKMIWTSRVQVGSLAVVVVAYTVAYIHGVDECLLLFRINGGILTAENLLNLVRIGRATK